MKPSIHRLLDIMKTLRGPTGCDWDKQQTLESLKPYLLEEVYEVLDTVDDHEKNPSRVAHHQEELGDLLLQIVFQAQIQEELGHFDFDDVVSGIVAKMERRHPHIFGDTPRPENIKGNPYWHAIKESEQDKDASCFASIAKGQPSLLRARKLGERAARFRFDWSNATQAFAKIHEEVKELEAALKANDRAHAEEELGDLLFAIAQVARHLDIDPELALHRGNEKFIARFQQMLDRAGGKERLKEMDLDAMEKLWQAIKAEEPKSLRKHES